MLLAPFLPQNFQGPFHSTDPWGVGRIIKAPSGPQPLPPPTPGLSALYQPFCTAQTYTGSPSEGCSGGS